MRLLISSSSSFTGISFTPKEVGEHEVSVRKNGIHVANSPFKIMVGQSEIGEASRVKAFGKGLVEAHTSETAEFFVDTRNAGELFERTCFTCSHRQQPNIPAFLPIPVQVTEDLRCRSRVQAKWT